MVGPHHYPVLTVSLAIYSNNRLDKSQCGQDEAVIALRGVAKLRQSAVGTCCLERDRQTGWEWRLVCLLESHPGDFGILVEIEERVHRLILEDGAIAQFHAFIALLPLMEPEFL
jgi:hypothetical protein